MFKAQTQMGGGGHRTSKQAPVQITSLVGGWLAGPVNILSLCGPTLQAEPCQILSLAENPRWSPSVAINMTIKINKIN